MSSAIRKVHEKYFEIIEDYFGIHYKQMERKKQNLEEATLKSCQAYSNQLADSVCDSLYQELREINWAANDEGIRKLGGIRACVESVFPGQLHDFFKRASLYADTIVVSGTFPPVFEITGRLPQRVIMPSSSVRIFTAISRALGLLQMKKMFLADTDEPIVVISNSPTFLRSSLTETYDAAIGRTSLELCSDIFGKKFHSMKAFDDFVLRKKNPETLAKSITKPELFVFDPTIPVKDQILYLMEVERSANPHNLQGLTDLDLLLWTVRHHIVRAPGRILSQFITCGALNAEPIAHNHITWNLTKWRFRRDNEFLSGKSQRKISKNQLVLDALRLDNFRWLGNVPIEGIVRMRKEGELKNLRDILGEGIKEIEVAKDEDYVEAANQVRYNLNEAFKRHGAESKRLDKELRRKYHLGAASLLVSGSIGVISAMFPPVAIAAGIIGGGSLIKVTHDILEGRSRRAELRRKPIALLFRAHRQTASSVTQNSLTR